MHLKVKNLVKSFDDVNVLNDLNIDLNGKKSIAIIGASGSGKTTFLRILAGLERPDSGEIYLNDHIVDFHAKKLRSYRKSIGMVFQAYNLFPHLTACENIMLPLVKVHGYDKKEACQIAEDLLLRFNLSEHSGKKAAELSGGQKQRIALCRAVAIKPKVLFLDEPTSALDPEFTSEVLRLVEELRKEGIELVMITHEMGFAYNMADHILFMDEGKILEEGTPAEIFNSSNPRVKKFFSDILQYEID
ncbi:MAG: glutamine ABC transporter ATP-binding protein [Candidatus Cloacimonadota bacterium]|nr:MAG: glutamine ABC transporter ATP-binding protein [Candidatus Cloacimonadota bacterium]